MKSRDILAFRFYMETNKCFKTFIYNVYFTMPVGNINFAFLKHSFCKQCNNPDIFAQTRSPFHEWFINQPPFAKSPFALKQAFQSLLHSSYYISYYIWIKDYKHTVLDCLKLMYTDYQAYIKEKQKYYVTKSGLQSHNTSRISE